MGQREETLKNYLTLKFGNNKYSKPKKKDFFNSVFNNEIETIYRKLNGIQTEYPTSYRGFDIQCNDFIVELDEERHFNRYRLLTLSSTFYNENNLFFDLNIYKNICQKKEIDCLNAAGWRGNWENKSTKKQFGESDKEGVLGQLGSSRWKQRAFYDFLRDISAQIMNIPIIRISIWQTIDNLTVDKLIEMKDYEKISNLIIKIRNYAC
jgi:hypothetical protein